MKLPEKTFQILDALDRQEISTQRQLADHSGISLGQVNYILKSLLDKGLVKIDNFKKSSRKISYAYLLTPKGIEAKSKLAVRFVVRKLREYDNLRNRLVERLFEIQDAGYHRVFFVGPPLVKEFINSIIREQHFNLFLSGQCSKWKNLEKVHPESFDVALLFDDSINGITKISDSLDIPQEKLLPLW